jgi:GNAT superfamily N-acetyltransferase
MLGSELRAGETAVEPASIGDAIAPTVYVPADMYSYEELAAIYNMARVDYIVPMPMNTKRMSDYVREYDVDLSASLLSLNDEREPTGVIMVGLRGERAWITRLGVIPERRGRKVGQGLMEASIQGARMCGACRVQLEVIQGNEPAHRLFLKLGFHDVRELLVVRRAPGPLDPAPVSTEVHAAEMVSLDEQAIAACLMERASACGSPIAWTEESASLRHMTNLIGLALTLNTGETGWIVCQALPFQLTHMIVNPGASPVMIEALFLHLHRRYPLHDAKIENLPPGDSLWETVRQMGYLEASRRVEMHLDLTG